MKKFSKEEPQYARVELRQIFNNNKKDFWDDFLHVHLWPG
jgi:hypothetical protein